MARRQGRPAARSSSSMARRCGLREIEVHFGTFDFTMYCVVGPPAGVEKYVRWRFEDHECTVDMAVARGRHFSRNGYCPVIWIPRKPRSPREYGTLAHEVLHAVRIMLEDWAGMTLCNTNDEAWCHALGYAMTTILEELRSS